MDTEHQNKQKNTSKNTHKINNNINSKSENDFYGSSKKKKKRIKNRTKTKIKITREFSSSSCGTTSGCHIQNNDDLYRLQYQQQHQKSSCTLLAEVCPNMILPLIAAIELKGKDRQGN